MNGIGIDVSKRRLDIGTTDGETVQVSNSPSGYAELSTWLSTRPAIQIVLEATGGYEQTVLDFLHKAGHPVIRANALRARRLAQGLGKVAKTDRLDALVLAQMAALVELPSYQPLEPWQRKLREFVRARRQTMQALTVARQQQEMVTDRELRRQMQGNIIGLQTLVERLGKQISEQVAQQPQLAVLKSMLARHCRRCWPATCLSWVRSAEKPLPAWSAWRRSPTTAGPCEGGEASTVAGPRSARCSTCRPCRPCDMSHDCGTFTGRCGPAARKGKWPSWR